MDKKIKHVVVKTHGQISLLGGLNGPINTPFPIELSRLFELVNLGFDVYEVNPKDKNQSVKLTRKNYNTDNFIIEETEAVDEVADDDKKGSTDLDDENKNPNSKEKITYDYIKSKDESKPEVKGDNKESDSDKDSDDDNETDENDEDGADEISMSTDVVVDTTKVTSNVPSVSKKKKNKTKK